MNLVGRQSAVEVNPQADPEANPAAIAMETLIKSSFPRMRESSSLIQLGSRLRGNDKIY